MNSKPKSTLKLDNLELSSPIAYSPLAGFSNHPFRKLSAKFQPSLMFCEMVNADALLHGNDATTALLTYEDVMRPLGAQIFGHNAQTIGKASTIIESMGFDVVDVNCGCPVDRITGNGCGSALLKNPQLIGDIICEIKAQIKLPVTVKIRIGWDEQSIVAPQITQIAEQAGAAAIFVHGRTRKQSYRGIANRSIIKECKDVANKILVFGNGDIFSVESALDMFEKTNCDGILVSRGAIKMPWLAEDIKLTLENKPIPNRDFQFIVKTFLEHKELVLEHFTDRLALNELKKISCSYMREISGARTFREQICKASSLDQIETLITELLQLD